MGKLARLGKQNPTKSLLNPVKMCLRGDEINRGKKLSVVGGTSFWVLCMHENRYHGTMYREQFFFCFVDFVCFVLVLSSSWKVSDFVIRDSSGKFAFLVTAE